MTQCSHPVIRYDERQRRVCQQCGQMILDTAPGGQTALGADRQPNPEQASQESKTPETASSSEKTDTSDSTTGSAPEKDQ